MFIGHRKADELKTTPVEGLHCAHQCYGDIKFARSYAGSGSPLVSDAEQPINGFDVS
jgi:hypothetical protein